MKIRIVIFLMLFSTILFGQNQRLIESEFDTICGLGVNNLKKLIVDRIECQRNNLYTSDLNLENCFDIILIDNKNIQLDYNDTISIKDFENELNNLTIRKLTWSKKYINENIGWNSKIVILTNQSKNIKSTGYKIEIPSKRNKIEKRTQNGNLIFQYPRPMNYLDIHQTEFMINSDDLKSDEMIIWIIYSELDVEFNMYVK